MKKGKGIEKNKLPGPLPCPVAVVPTPAAAPGPHHGRDNRRPPANSFLSLTVFLTGHLQQYGEVHVSGGDIKCYYTLNQHFIPQLKGLDWNFYSGMKNNSCILHLQVSYFAC